MQHTEYTCDWCHKPTDPGQANRLGVSPAVADLVGANDPEPMDRIQKNLANMAAREKRRFSADICDGCFTIFREWIAGKQ